MARRNPSMETWFWGAVIVGGAGLAYWLTRPLPSGQIPGLPAPSPTPRATRQPYAFDFASVVPRAIFLNGQQQLIDLGLLAGPPNGIDDDATRAAIQRVRALDPLVFDLDADRRGGNAAWIYATDAAWARTYSR